MLSIEELTQATWHCLHFVFPEDEAAVRALLTRSDLAVFEIDGHAVETKEQLLSAVAGVMRFPNYFGMNWDSLDECLRDPDVMPANGCVLFVRGAEPFWQRASQIAGEFVEIWISAAEEWGQARTPFHLVFVW